MGQRYNGIFLSWKEWEITMKEKKENCFPDPQEKYTTSPTSNTVTRGEEKPYKKDSSSTA